MSSPGASSPQCDRDSQTLSDRTAPMKEPSWCHAPVTDGSTFRNVVFLRDSTTGSPRSAAISSGTPAASRSSNSSNASRGESATRRPPVCSIQRRRTGRDDASSRNSS